jgi:glutamate--cysteine ligase
MIIYWSQEDQAFIVEVPELPGCMADGKTYQEAVQNAEVIIQEGVYTFETWNEAVAEPVVYMLGQYVVGGFYRVHTGRGVSDNLNTPGMQFEPLPFVKACNIPDQTKQQKGKCANRFYVYGVIARLALLAAAREQADLLKKME